MGKLRLSISLQTYNRGHSGYLRTALEAILAQTCGDFELLVIDNHSTDETPDVVLSFKDPRLSYIRLAPGGSPADSMRAALIMSRGTHLLTTHDDDIMMPTMVEEQLACIRERPDLACLATNVCLIDSANNVIQDRLYEISSDRFFEVGDYIRTYLEEKLWFPTPTLLLQREAAISGKRSIANDKNPRYLPSGDIAGLFRLNTRHPIGILATPLLKYRQHPGQESRNVDQSNPLVTLAAYAEKLITTHRSDPHLRAILPAVRAFSMRYQAQDMLFNAPKESLDLRLRALKTRWKKSVTPEARGIDAALPFEILLGESGHGITIPTAALDRLMYQAANSGSQLAYRQWAQLLHNGKHIFPRNAGLRKIAILGSMLTAHLLVLAAKRSGIEIAFCLDSSPARIGRHVFDIPVVPHDHLLKHGDQVNAVILSSERDQEEGLRKLLQPAQERWRFDVHSWKDLAATKAAEEGK